VVEGGGEVVATEGGEVTLDLKALLGQTEQRVGVGGRVQAAIPEDAAQLTIMKSDQLELVQDAVRFLRAAAVVLVVLALGLLALGVYLASGWRRRALRTAGFGLLLAGVAALVARSFVGDAVVGALATTEAVKPAAEAAWSISTSLLVEAASATIAYGVVLIGAAISASRRPPVGMGHVAEAARIAAGRAVPTGSRRPEYRRPRRHGCRSRAQRHRLRVAQSWVRRKRRSARPGPSPPRMRRPSG
jgi:hypothetical protein